MCIKNNINEANIYFCPLKVWPPNLYDKMFQHIVMRSGTVPKV